MDPLTMGLITGGANLLGSIFTGWQSGENTEANIEAQRQSQRETQNFNAQQAEINRQFQSGEAGVNRQFQEEQVMANRRFQEQMSNTAYQRAMSDMKSAGLNPILAYQRGGASQPTGGAASGAQGSGSAASVSAPNMALHGTVSPFAGIGDAVGKAVSSAVQMKTFDKMTEEISNIQADAALRKAEERLTRQKELTEFLETHKRQFEKGKSEAELMPAVLKSSEVKAILDMPAWMRDLLVQSAYSGGKLGDTVAPLVSSAKNLRALLPSRSRVETTMTDTLGHGRSTFQERFTGGY